MDWLTIGTSFKKREKKQKDKQIATIVDCH